MVIHMEGIVRETKTKSFRISHVAQKNPANMPRAHIHKEYELYFLLEGERYYFIEDSTYRVENGSLVLVPSGSIHRTAYAVPGGFHERILLQLNEDYLAPLLHKLGLPPLSSFFSIPVLQPSAADQKHLLQIFDNIFAELSSKQANYDVAVQLKLMELLLLISRCSTFCSDTATPPPTVMSAKYKKVNEATFYIKEHFHEPLSLQSIADSIFVSRGYLSNIFNEVAGMKLTDYINIQRINYAKTLLSSSDESITSIADKCGFESITYFEKIFNSVTGSSPLKFRQSLLQAQKREE